MNYKLVFSILIVMTVLFLSCKKRSFNNLTEDLALMVEAGINTIRVYAPIGDKAVLD